MKMRIDMYGPVSFRAVPYAQKTLERLDRAGEPMAVDIRLVQLVAPAMSQPAVAQANLIWNGHSIEAHATGHTMYAAIDLVHDLLRRQMAHAPHPSGESTAAEPVGE